MFSMEWHRRARKTYLIIHLTYFYITFAGADEMGSFQGAARGESKLETENAGRATHQYGCFKCAYLLKKKNPIKGNGNECEAQNATAVANFKARANRLRKKLLSGDSEEWTAQHLQPNEFHTMQQAQAAQPNDYNPIQQQQQNAFSPSQQVQQQFAQPKEHNEPEQQARAVRPAKDCIISHIAAQPNEFNAFGTSSSAILGQPEGVQ
jgi:hypothetical protein